MNLKSSLATEAVAKIEKLSKLVVGGNVTIKDIFMAQAIKDNIPDGAKIALMNTMAYLDREPDIIRFTEFKSAFKQIFAAPPPSNDTFYGQNITKDYNSKEHPRECRERPDSRSRDSRRKYKSPYPPRTRHSGSNRSNSCGHRNSNNR